MKRNQQRLRDPDLQVGQICQVRRQTGSRVHEIPEGLFEGESVRVVEMQGGSYWRVESADQPSRSWRIAGALLKSQG